MSGEVQDRGVGGASARRGERRASQTILSGTVPQIAGISALLACKNQLFMSG